MSFQIGFFDKFQPSKTISRDVRGIKKKEKDHLKKIYYIVMARNGIEWNDVEVTLVVKIEDESFEEECNASD